MVWLYITTKPSFFHTQVWGETHFRCLQIGNISNCLFLFFNATCKCSGLLLWLRTLASLYQQEKQLLYGSSSTKRFIYWCCAVSLCSSVTAGWMVVKSDSIIGVCCGRRPLQAVCWLNMRSVISATFWQSQGTNERGTRRWISCLNVVVEEKYPNKTNKPMYFKVFFSVLHKSRKYTLQFTY